MKRMGALLFGGVFCFFPVYSFSEVVLKRENQKSIDCFLENVLRQFPSRNFQNILKDLPKEFDLSQASVTKENQFYESLRIKIDKAKDFFFLKQLKALNFQKKLLSDQTCQLLPLKEVGMVLELGTPGTYLSQLRSHLKITGKTYVIDEKNLFKDRVFNFSWRPFSGFKSFDFFVPLKKYSPIESSDISPGSIDLIICYIGFHHIPLSKRQVFIDSLLKLLKPGGFLVLREHEALDQKAKDIIGLAHTLYNLIALSLPFEEEKNEVRNFESLDFWINFLKDRGLILQSITDPNISEHRGLLQEGDPTKNTLMLFRKPPFTPLPVHKRPLINTFMSAPEWYNVDVSREYARFIEQTPFYEFPFFQSVGTFWKVFANSYRLSREKASFWGVVFSDYMMMSTFVGIMMTLEYGLKGLISAPIRWLMGDAEDRFIDIQIDNPKHQALNISYKLLSQNKEKQWLRVPRYMEFKKAIIELSRQNIQILDIAGNKEIQIKVSFPPGHFHLLSPVLYKDSLQLYCWQLPEISNKIYVSLIAPVSKLHRVISRILDHRINIEYIHDY